MPEAKRTPTTLSASPSFNLQSLQDIGRRLFELTDLEDGMGTKLGTKALRRLARERQALMDLGITLRPRTLEDAGALAGIAFSRADVLIESAGPLEGSKDVEDLRRAFAGIALALKAHGIDVDLLGWGDLSGRCEAEFEVRGGR
jgi:hypothetical protein